MKKFIFPALALFAILGFQNCSDVSFQTSSNKLDDGPTKEEIDNVNILCNNAGANLQTKTFTINFDNPYVNGGDSLCKWNENGNINARDQFVTARREERVPVTLPANSDICGASFSFPKQDQQYDDQFFFIFNNKIVASNALFAIDNGRVQRSTYNLGAKTVSVPTYDWANIVNTSWPANFNDRNVSEANNFCLGKDQGIGNCTWPITQVDGDISMSFDPSLMRAVGLDGQDSTHEVGFVMTGDNDPTTDCQHKPLSFTVTVQYIIK